MKVIVKITDQVSVECESENSDDLFKQIAAAMSNQSFLGDSKCGACGTTNVQYVVRENDGFEFFEQHCKNKDCRARLSFGKGKEGSKELYPKRCETIKNGKDKGHAVKGPDGKAVLLPNNGWVKYDPQQAGK